MEYVLHNSLLFIHFVKGDVIGPLGSRGKLYRAVTEKLMTSLVIRLIRG